ncbi:MAG: class I SAM-dependent methyltransferase, partial [Salibacteraceae bacterium]
APKNQAETDQDKYESIADNIDFYTWLAYGSLNSKNNSKNIYPRINQLLHEQLEQNQEWVVLDVGCGVGRTLYDNSRHFTNSQFIGFDYSLNMLKRARQILLEGDKLQVDLSSSGLPAFNLNGIKQNNVHLIQGSVDELPFKTNLVDVVINTFLIDRVEDVRLALAEMVKVLKPGGLFILSSPLNFQTTKGWEFGNPQAILSLLTELGIEQLVFEDNILHEEVLDSRGNTKLWNALVIYGRKRQV